MQKWQLFCCMNLSFHGIPSRCYSQVIEDSICLQLIMLGKWMERYCLSSWSKILTAPSKNCLRPPCYLSIHLHPLLSTNSVTRPLACWMANGLVEDNLIKHPTLSIDAPIIQVIEGVHSSASLIITYHIRLSETFLSVCVLQSQVQKDTGCFHYHY